MAPKRAAAHSPAGQRSAKKKQSRATNPFIDDEAEESISGHDTDGDSSQKSAYSLARGADTQAEEAGEYVHVDTLGNEVDESYVPPPVGPGHALVNTTFTISTANPETGAADVPAGAVSSDSGGAAAHTASDAPSAVAAAAAVPNASPSAAAPDAQVAAPGAQVAAAPLANPPAAVAGATSTAVVNAPHVLPPSGLTVAADYDWTYGPVLNKRITRMVSFADAGELIYDVTRVPTNAAIASIETEDKNDAYMLSVPGRRAPLTIWVIGTLTRTYFHDQEGGAPKSVSVNLRPLHNAHLSAANNLLRQFSTFAPGENPERYDTIRAQRWMNAKRPGDIAEHIEKFRAVYDARNALLSPRDRMATVFPADLKRGDLVLLELHLSRYRKSSDNDGGSTKSSPRRKGDGWAAFFMLKSICLLDDTERDNGPLVDLAIGTWEI